MKTRALLLALPLAMIACRDNRASVKITSDCAPTSDCTFTNKCEASYVGYPTIDTASSPFGSLQMYFEVQNDLPNNANEVVGRLNTNDAHVDETVVEFEGPALRSAVLQTNHRVPAEGTTVFRVEVIPEVIGPLTPLQNFAGGSRTPRDMVAKLRLRGYYDDGSRFETGEFPVAVRVCSGCLARMGCTATQSTCPPLAVGQLPVVCIDPTGAGTI